MTTNRTGGLLTFGESMGLISTRDIGSLDIARSAVIGIGGAESNVAIAVSRLGHPATWIGRLGRDAVGDLICRRLHSESVQAHVTRDAAFTGIMIRHSRTAGVTHVDYHRAGSAGSRLCPDDIPADLIRNAAILHVTGITAAISATATAAVRYAVDTAHDAGVPVSIDVNYRRKLWRPDTARTVLTSLLPYVDIIFAGVEEAQLLLDDTNMDPADLARGLAASGASEVIIKQGAQGCTALIDGAAHQVPALPAHVVEQVGAGDAFVAGYIAERLGGAAAAQRLTTAIAMGAYAVAVPGDCELLPSRAELDEMLHTTDVIR